MSFRSFLVHHNNSFDVDVWSPQAIEFSTVPMDDPTWQWGRMYDMGRDFRAIAGDLFALRNDFLLSSIISILTFLMHELAVGLVIYKCWWSICLWSLNKQTIHKKVESNCGMLSAKIVAYVTFFCDSTMYLVVCNTKRVLRKVITTEIQTRMPRSRH